MSDQYNTESIFSYLQDNIEITVTDIASRPDRIEVYQPNRRYWSIILTNIDNKEVLHTFYSNGVSAEIPKANDILYNLNLDAHSATDFNGFEDFCGEFYGRQMTLAEHKSAKRCWKACKRVVKDLKRLLGDKFEDFMALSSDEIEALGEEAKQANQLMDNNSVGA